MGKLKNRIPSLHLLISSLPGSASRTHVESVSKPRDLTSVLEALPGKLDKIPGLASRTHVESLGKPRDSTSFLEAMPGKLDIKRHSPNILYDSLVLLDT